MIPDPRKALHLAVREAYDAGLCVMPPKEDGSKAPEAITWQEYQRERVPLDDLRRAYRNGRTGIGFVCGTVSGGLECLDFDTKEIYKAFRQACGDAGLDDLLERMEQGYSEETPHGFHLLYRPTKCGASHKLAREVMADGSWKTLIEVKAEGGYIIVSPSYGNVNSDGPYIRLSGSATTIPHITQEDRDALFRVARTFDTVPKVASIPCRVVDGDDRSMPGVDFNHRGDWWGDVLVPAGWTFTGAGIDREGNRQEFWRRPGKDHGNSAVLHPDAGAGGLFVPFSTSTPFPETEEGYSKWRCYAILHHDSDFEAAAGALKRRGFGQAKEPDRLWTLPSPLAMSGSAVFDLDVPEIQTLPMLGQAGMVVENGSNLLYAFPKTGKTELIRHVLQEWIGMGRRILYLTEEPLWFWKPRLRQYDHPAQFWNGVMFLCSLGWTIREVLEFLDAAEMDVLIVDTLRNTCGFQEGKGDEDVSRVVVPLIAASREKSATLLALYHARKMPGEGGRDISGHHSLYGAFDRALQLKELPGEENKSKRRLNVSGRLLRPDSPNGLTYEMQPDGTFRALDVKTMAGWQKTCEVCGRTMDASRTDKKTCSETCKKRAQRESK